MFVEVGAVSSAGLSFGLERLLHHDLEARDHTGQGLADLLDRGAADVASALDRAARRCRCRVFRLEPHLLSSGDRSFNSAARGGPDIATDLGHALHDGSRAGTDALGGFDTNFLRATDYPDDAPLGRIANVRPRVSRS